MHYDFAQQDLSVYGTTLLFSKDWLKSKTERAWIRMEKIYSKTIYTLLNLLNIQPMCGYEIKLTLKKLANDFWSESDGQIYPGLQKCVDEGLASIEADTNQSKYLQKKHYKILPKGQALLNVWLLNTESKITHRDESLLKLTFLQKQHHNQAKQLLLARLKNSEASLKVLKQLDQDKPEQATLLPYFAWVQERQRIMLEAEIQWAQQSLKMLSNDFLAS
jgi:PadR family transcriptional regulator AphA